MASGAGADAEQRFGTANWIFGVQRALLTTEALRTAMREFGNQPMTGEQVSGDSNTSPSRQRTSRR